MKKVATAVVLIFVTVYCDSHSKILSSWKQEFPEPREYSKVMVMAIFPDLQTRATAEEALVRNLSEYGINAHVSYDLFPLAGKQQEILALAKDTSVVRQIKEHMRDKIRANGVEGMFMISMYDVEKTQDYHENQVLTGGFAYGYYPSWYGAVPSNYYGSYYDYYVYNLGTVHTAGYYTTETTYYIQTNLFDVETDRLIYAVQGSTLDYHDIEAEAQDLGNKVVKDMMYQNVLRTPQRK